MAKGARTRLGAPFAWLLGAGGSSNLVDGLLLAAGPLMVAHLTADPFFVALAVVAQQIPWLLFGLLAGVVADRRSRVAIIAVGSGARALTLLAVAAFLLTGAMSLPLLYAALFLIGTTEAFMDNAWSSLVPDLVPSEHLGVANGRTSGVMTLTNQLLGPAIGGLLFAVGAAVPYGGAALLSAVAVVLVLRVRVPGRGALRSEPVVDAERPTTGVIPLVVTPPTRPRGRTTVRRVRSTGRRVRSTGCRARSTTRRASAPAPSTRRRPDSCARCAPTSRREHDGCGRTDRCVSSLSSSSSSTSPSARPGA